MSTFTIRPVLPKDDIRLAEVIREVLVEHGVPKVGTAYEDEALSCMHKTYPVPRAQYFVVDTPDEGIIGGAGVAQLANFEGNICELQKMYFLPIARGRGIGSAMIDLCLKTARDFRFDQCYLETMPNMHAAQNMYKHKGFHYIDGAMGNTGHYSCPVHMLIDL